VFHYRNASSLALPRQPVPLLAQTMTQYLHSLEPLVNPKDLEQTRQLVAAFEAPGGEGERLQNHLPLVVHSSPAVVLPKQDFNDWRGQL
ncbi:putative Carnitine O-acetyltransferase-like protein, partial [Naja naja]